MTKPIIQTVNNMAYQQGYKLSKFINRKKQPMILNPIDTLKGIGAMAQENVDAIEKLEEEYVLMLPHNGPEDDNVQLISDSSIDCKELVNIDDEGPQDYIHLDEDAPADNNNQPDVDQNISTNDDPGPYMPNGGR